MEVLIFGGFLGSGKTTALMQMARYAVGSGRSVMIIENEIGDTGIDDAFLRGGGFKVENLFAGCACCTVTGELASIMGRIRREYNPDLVILETTGLAYPQEIKKNLREAFSIESRVAVLADASRWKRLRIPMENLLVGQIKGSDAVVINKTDLVSEEILGEVERDIRSIDSDTKIMRICAKGAVSDDVWKEVLGDE